MVNGSITYLVRFMQEQYTERRRGKEKHTKKNETKPGHMRKAAPGSPRFLFFLAASVARQDAGVALKRRVPEPQNRISFYDGSVTPIPAHQCSLYPIMGGSVVSVPLMTRMKTQTVPVRIVSSWPPQAYSGWARNSILFTGIAK